LSIHGSEIAVTIIKQCRFNTDNALLQQLGKEILFLWLVPIRQFVITVLTRSTYPCLQSE
jgi:hypothetical protein